MGSASSPDGPRTLQSPLRLVLAITLCAAVLAGCGKKDTVVGPPVTPKYGLPSSPLIVMNNLKTAYTAKDSVAYRACFDFSYVGDSQDLRTQTPIDTLYFANEAEHIAALARSTAIVEIQLVPVLVRRADSGDPPGWALIQNPILSLAIHDGPVSFNVVPQDETIEFRFIPTPDSASPTDTTWKIIRWSEIAY